MSQPPGPSADPRALPPGPPTGALVTEPAGGALTANDLASQLWAERVEPQEAHFWDYWRVLVRHRWTVISFFLVTLIVATVWTFTTRPVFTATATLRIEKEEPRVLKFEQVVPTEQADYQQTQYQTQLKILQSRTLASRVIGLLGLDQHPEFQDAERDGEWWSTAQAWARERLVQWIPVPPPPAPEASEDLVLESPLTRTFQKRLAIEPVRNARLVKLNFESHYPDLAARVANTLAEAYIAQSLDQKVETTRYATQFLAKQMEEARAKLEESEDRLNRFLEDNDILFLGSPDKTGERQDLVTQQLTILSEALLKARADRITRESVVHQALSRDVDALPAVLQNPLVAKLKEELVTLEGESRKLAQTFKPEYPRMQRFEQTIAEVRRQLRTEITRVVEALDADYRAALRSEQELEKAVSEHRSLARRLGDKMARFSLLRRDVDTSRELYTALLTRLKETQISSALVTSNISVVDRAEVPMTPSKPRKGLNLLLASVIGLFGGVGLTFFFEYLDTNIKDAKEVESVLRVPTIGLVPSQGSLEGRRARRRRRLAEEDGDSGPFALVAHAETESALAETFRNLRTSILYSAPDHPPKTLVVTSLQPEDGKTSIASNLAITLAQLGAGEVLLVDGDMRRPNLHELFDVPQAPGLSTFLTGQAELTAVLKPTRIPNLYVIPSGRSPLNPAELLASARLRQALDVLGERFAHVVFDSPPLIGVSDALILAPRLEGAILVLRQGRASRDAAQRGIHLLRSVRARVLGVILNDMDLRAAGAGYYGYYGYYGYGYGVRGRES
jgi:capsular exopolysaccharide synthesis family protein